MRDVTKQLITSAVAAMLFGKDLVSGSVYGFEWETKRETAKGTTGSCVIRHSNNATMVPGLRLPHSSM